MLKEFIAYLEEQVRNFSIYVLGAIGQAGDDITESWIKYREHYNASNYKRAINLWNDRKYIHPALKAFDCNGLGNFFLLAKKLVTTRNNANNMRLKLCDTITRAELKIGDWTFRKNSIKRYHIGYIVGLENGKFIVVHAKGRSDGVVRETIDANGSTYWNDFGRPKMFKAEIEASGPVQPSTFTVKRILKNIGKPYMKGADIQAVQNALESFGFSCGGADGVFGKKTEKAVIAFQRSRGLTVDGIVGRETVRALGGVWQG